MSKYDHLPLGWLSDREADILQELVEAHVPMGGYALEIGSFLGRSAVAISDMLIGDAKLVCVDAWMGKLSAFGTGALAVLDGDTEGFDANKEIYEEFIRNTHLISSIYPVRYYSGEFDWLFPKPPSLIYIDGDHSTQALTDDLDYCFTRWQGVRGRTVVCGHDYGNPHLPHVAGVVDSWAARNGFTVEVPEGGTIFVLREKLPEQIPTTPAPLISAD